MRGEYTRYAGMRGMCAMLDVSQIRLWFESCENTRMRVAGGAG